MFSHYDQNNNARLEAEELWQAAERDHLGQLSASCILADMLLFDDPDADGTLDINEFYAAFSKLYSKWKRSLSFAPPPSLSSPVLLLSVYPLSCVVLVLGFMILVLLYTKMLEYL